MKKLLILISFLCIRQLKAQTYVLIPDANFATFLHGIIPAAMNGDSLDITNTLVTTTTQTINVNSTSISNLYGIQYFSSLKYLYCDYNYSLQTLPTLPSTLLTLICSSNSLSTLPSLPNSLTYLDCRFNSLTSLPSLGSSLLTVLCSSNLLTTLPSLPNSLTYLDCRVNSLTSLPSLGNSLLTLLCTSNSLTTLPSLPNSLTYLDCRVNSLTSLPSLGSSLLTLLCTSNSLTTLPSLPNSLTYLDCTSNSLTSLPALPNSLNELYCEHNNISCFPTFPSSIKPYVIGHLCPFSYKYYISLSPNPFNCLPNYLPSAMSPSLLAYPLCSAGNSNGCPDGISGVNNLKSNNDQLSVYPNPASVQFIIETTNTEKQTMQLFDVNGKLVLTENMTGKAIIDVGNLNDGVYNLTLTSNEGIINKKLVIVK